MGHDVKAGYNLLCFFIKIAQGQGAWVYYVRNIGGIANLSDFVKNLDFRFDGLTMSRYF